MPNKHIDTDASWCYSPRHKWVYGYGLHVISNMFHFPVSAIVTTAKVREETQVAALLAGRLKKMILLIGDKGYRVILVIEEIFEKCSIFVKMVIVKEINKSLVGKPSRPIYFLMGNNSGP